MFCNFFQSLLLDPSALTLSILYTAFNWPFSLKETGPVLHSYKQRGTALLFYVNQHQYSPDMAPCDFSLFPQYKNILKDKQFENMEIIILNAMQQLLQIPEHSMRSVLAVEEPMEYMQPSRKDILQGESVHLKGGLVLLVSQCQSGYFFIWPHTHTHSIKFLGTANHAIIKIYAI